jgi:hypothetical protein
MGKESESFTVVDTLKFREALSHPTRRLVADDYPIGIFLFLKIHLVLISYDNLWVSD